jgi:hypothetical protein
VLLVLFAAVVAGPVGPPPPLPASPQIRYGLAVHGRLKADALLKVFETESYVTEPPPPSTSSNSGPPLPTGPRPPTGPATPIPGPATLCYQHGTSRRSCTGGGVGGMWSVRLLSGRDQFLTLRVNGATVARLAYRDVNIPGPPAPSEAPVALTPLPPAPAPAPGSPPAPRFARGGLYGPASVTVGAIAYLWTDRVAPATLCYKHGSSRVHCVRSQLGGFYLTVLPGRLQYFTLRRRGEIISRLVYRRPLQP